MKRFYSYTEKGYEFKCYYGNFQHIKYDDKKEDYYITFYNRRFYFNECIRTGTPWTSDDKKHNKEYNIVGTWQEGYTVYELQTKENCDFCEDSLVRIVYCPPSSRYIGE